MNDHIAATRTPAGEFVLTALAKLEQRLRLMASRDLAAASTQRRLGRHSHAYYGQGCADARAVDAQLVAECYETIRTALGLE